MNIGEQIKKRRLELNLTQKELGERLGVSQQMIGHWENNRDTLKLTTIEKIFKALDLTFNPLNDEDFKNDSCTPMCVTYLELIHDLINNNFFTSLNIYSHNDLKELSDRIVESIVQGKSITDTNEKENYYAETLYAIFNEIIDKILDSFSLYDYTSVIELLSRFYNLNENGRYKVLDYQYDLSGNKEYIDCESIK